LNLDKSIINNKLFERLDELSPPTDTSSTKNNSDGINYWKGKKIVSLAEWRKIANSNKAFQKGIEHQNTKEALQVCLRIGNTLRNTTGSIVLWIRRFLTLIRGQIMSLFSNLLFYMASID
jgi:hypothetical protein